ncbi:MAG: sugar ABC transporter permease [Oscillospiraceae bacterium]|nr:sugar ABC transporter permease [Oscillospiraceae bacterium]
MVLKRDRPKTIARRKSITGYLFMSPWILGFLIFTAFPFVYTIYLSFYEVQSTILGYELTPIGIGNYVVALLRNAEFVPSLVSFMIMEITYAPTIVIISFILALLLNRPMRGRGFLRMLFFLPVIVMSGPVMQQIADSGAASMTGIEDQFIFVVIDNIAPWLAEALFYLFENFSMVLWFTGIPIILFINGLQKLNGSVLEAAMIDSATPWQILWKITIPILRPVFLVVMIFTVVQISIYTSGTGAVLDLVQSAIFNTSSGFGLASAFAWIYSLAVLLFIGCAFLLLKEPKDTPVKIQKRLERKWSAR